MTVLGGASLVAWGLSVVLSKHHHPFTYWAVIALGLVAATFCLMWLDERGRVPVTDNAAALERNAELRNAVGEALSECATLKSQLDWGNQKVATLNARFLEVQGELRQTLRDAGRADLGGLFESDAGLPSELQWPSGVPPLFVEDADDLRLRISRREWRLHELLDRLSRETSGT